jgi:hypothetical protein
MVGDSVISGFLSPTEEPYYHCEGFSSFRASQLYFCQDDLSGKEKTLPNGLTFIATPSNQDEFEAMKALSLLTGQE